jgi:hypothetical protein
VPRREGLCKKYLGVTRIIPIVIGIIRVGLFVAIFFLSKKPVKRIFTAIPYALECKQDVVAVVGVVAQIVTTSFYAGVQHKR